MLPKIRIGVILPVSGITLSEHEMLTNLINSDSCTVNAFLIEHRETASKKPSIIYLLYKKFDRKLFKSSKDFCQTITLDQLPGDIPKFEIPKQGIMEDDFDKINNLKLDILISLGEGSVFGQYMNISRLGVLVTNYYDSLKMVTKIPAYWEFSRRNGEMGIVVEWYQKDIIKPAVIYRSWELMNHYSLNLNVNRIYGRGSGFIPRIINDLHSKGDQYLTYLKEKYSPSGSKPDIAILGTPSFFDAFANLVGTLFIILRHIWKKIFYIDYWFLAIDVDKENKGRPHDFSKFIRIDSPKDRFYADPFVITKGDRYYLFVEEYIIQDQRGHITMLEVDEKGKCLSSKIIIKQPYHMAYPFIFEQNNEFYMIPDTSQNRTIELYRCVSFPGEWEFVKVLMKNVYAADTTLLFHENKWWMFTSIDATGNICGFDTEMSIFYADDFSSDDWQPHVLNPIHSDTKIARGAGRIFSENKLLYRPSQYCFGIYGKGFNVNRIIKLNELEYVEQLEERVITDWNPKLLGTHTYNSHGGFTVIDVFTHRPRFW